MLFCASYSKISEWEMFSYARPVVLNNSVFPLSSVAKKILTMKKHHVNLSEDCIITVEARPVQLMVPNLVEVQQRD